MRPIRAPGALIRPPIAVPDDDGLDTDLGEREWTRRAEVQGVDMRLRPAVLGSRPMPRDIDGQRNIRLFRARPYATAVDGAALEMLRSKSTRGAHTSSTPRRVQRCRFACTLDNFKPIV